MSSPAKLGFSPTSANLTASAVYALCQTTRQHVQPEVAVVARRASGRASGSRVPRSRRGWRRQPLTEDRSYHRMLPCEGNDVLDGVGVDVPNGELIQIRCEPATRLHFALRVHNRQRCPGLRSSLPRTRYRPTDRLVDLPHAPVARWTMRRHGHIVADKHVAAQHIRPRDHAVELGFRQALNRFQPLSGARLA